MAESTLLIILPPDELSPEQVTQIEAAAPNLRVVVTDDEHEILHHAPNVEVITGRFDTDVLQKMPNLRWFQQWGAGADWLLDDPVAQAAPYVVTSASGIHAIQISEHIFALLLAFGRNLPQAFTRQQEHAWASPDWGEVFELANKSMLLLGVGAIGSRTASLAHAHGMQVIGLRRDAEKDVEGIDVMVSSDDLHSALGQADFVVMTIPLTAETHNFIGEQELAIMKPSALLVNIGRGGTIDESALIDALQTGQIAGAGLDVTEQEPLPADSPLWDMENVIITAHYAGKTPHYTDRALALFTENLTRYVAGQELDNLVDKQLGY